MWQWTLVWALFVLVPGPADAGVAAEAGALMSGCLIAGQENQSRSGRGWV